MSGIFELIKDTVPIHDLMDQAGVHYTSRKKGCKVSCPFHGADVRKSGFIYVDTNTFHCFTCNQSWDQISFWAQANEWYKRDHEGKEVLDMGKAINSLKEMYGIEYTAPSWEQKYRSLSAEPVTPNAGYAGFPLADRRAMVQLALWEACKGFTRMSREDRERTWPAVRDLWDAAGDLDIERDDWKDLLNVWKERATLIV